MAPLNHTTLDIYISVIQARIPYGKAETQLMLLKVALSHFQTFHRGRIDP